MKKLLLLLLLPVFQIGYSQNLPVAVDDSIYVEAFANSEPLTFFAQTLIGNDYHQTAGQPFNFHAINYLGVNEFKIISGFGNGSQFSYKILNSNITSDSCQYVIASVSGGGPVYDTGMIYFKINPPSFDSLEVNNIKTYVDKNVLFNGPGYYTPGFETEKGAGIHSIFAANLWIAGDNSGTLYSNLRSYGSGLGGNNFVSNSGPVSSTSHTDTITDPKWNRVWKIKRSDIIIHLAYFNTPGYNPPKSFLDWPAHGDVTKGESFDLAPFVDVDGDGYYDPYMGDYPQIKGDEAIYFIYNDGMSEISSHPMMAEVHGMAYAFQCTDDALANTIFLDYTIYNRSKLDYAYTIIGLWADFDLGNGQDDQMQTDVQRSMFYVLNGDDYDEDGFRPGYGEYPAAQGVVTLKGTKLVDDSKDNGVGIGLNQSPNGTGFDDGVIDNERWGLSRFISFVNAFNGPNTDPTWEYDYSYYLQGKWKDGTNVKYGGSGHTTSSGATIYNARFIYPGNSDPWFYGTGGVSLPSWTAQSAGIIPSDTRGVGSMGDIDFKAGDKVELSYAFVTGRSTQVTGVQAGVDVLLERTDSIKSYFNQGLLDPCGPPLGIGDSPEIDIELNIYPNPTTDFIQVTGLMEMAEVSVFDVKGAVVIPSLQLGVSQRLDVSHLPKGVYIVKAVSGDENYIAKFVKQ